MSWSSRRERTCSRAKSRSATSPAARARPATPMCARSWRGPSPARPRAADEDPPRVHALLPAREHRRAAPPDPAARDFARGDGAPRESLPDAIPVCGRPASTTRPSRPRPPTSRSSLSSQPTRRSPPGARFPAPARLGALLADLDAGESVEEPAAEEITVLCRRTSALAAAAGGRRDPHGLWFFEQSLLKRRRSWVAAI